MDQFCIIGLIFLLFLVVAGAIVAPILISAAVGAKRRRKFINEFSRQNQSLLSRGTWFPVRYASQRRFKSWFKFYPWEAGGILWTDGWQISFFTNKLPRRFEGKTQLDFNAREARVVFYGEDLLRSGVLTWIEISTPREKHYFTSETGTFVFGTSASTQQIYQGLLEVLQKKV